MDRGYLTDAELQKIMKKKFPTKRLEQVRDVFLFSCYTGLSYVDVKELKASDIRISFDGKPWIMTHRHKTDTPVNVPLLKIPQAILQKYEGQLPKGQLLPVLSNQKLNSYLKEIADLCGINKILPSTWHVTRLLRPLLWLKACRLKRCRKCWGIRTLKRRKSMPA